jgi:cyclase
VKQLRSLVLAGACLLLASAASAQSRHVTTTRLTDKLYLLSVDEDNYSTNSLAFVGADGVLLVDTQAPEDAHALKAVVDAFGKGAPRYIINTHRHVEHIGGNAIFGPTPVKIAHVLFAEHLRSGRYAFQELPAAAFPDISVADSLTLIFDGERIRVVALPGSHDDNELIVHFVDQGVVHLSSLTNGFNFPSVDVDGDALRFPELADRAMALLPHDVRIISGHSPLGEHRMHAWSELQSYRDMMARCIAIVRSGLAQGRDVAALQRDSVLKPYGAYARSYVDEDGWIATLAARLQHEPDRRPTAYADLYATWRAQGAAAAVARFAVLRRDRAAEFRNLDVALVLAGEAMLTNGHVQDAVTFFEGSLREVPNGRLDYYANYQLALAQRQLGHADAARRACQRALALNASYAPALALLEELNRP